MLSLPRSPQRRHALALLCLSLLCWGGLALPGTHSTQVPWYEDLFTAVSAVSTTGLTTVPTGETYTWFGELVVLAFVQLGGLGYMGLLSFILLRPHRRLDDDDAAVVSEDQKVERRGRRDPLRAAGARLHGRLRGARGGRSGLWVPPHWPAGRGGNLEGRIPQRVGVLHGGLRPPGR